MGREMKGVKESAALAEQLRRGFRKPPIIPEGKGGGLPTIETSEPQMG